MESISLLLCHLVCCKKSGLERKVSPVENFKSLPVFPSLYRCVCARCLSVLSQLFPPMNINVYILARVAAQKWLKHWKAIMKSESCLCQFISSSLVTSLLTPLLLKKEKILPPFSLIPLAVQLELKKAGLFSLRREERRGSCRIKWEGARQNEKDRGKQLRWEGEWQNEREREREGWRKKRGGWEEGDLHRAEQGGVWSRKLARQQRQLYSTDTMREAPQWESCREQACTTLSHTHRIKARTCLKIHPMKGKGGDISYTQTPTER